MVLGFSLKDQCETEVLTSGVLSITARMGVQTSVLLKVTSGPQLLPQLFTIQTTEGLTLDFCLEQIQKIQRVTRNLIISALVVSV